MAKENILEVNAFIDYDQLSTDVLEKLKPELNKKQNIEEPTLKTVAKNIPEAINELNDKGNSGIFYSIEEIGLVDDDFNLGDDLGLKPEKERIKLVSDIFIQCEKFKSLTRLVIFNIDEEIYPNFSRSLMLAGFVSDLNNPISFIIYKEYINEANYSLKYIQDYTISNYQYLNTSSYDQDLYQYKFPGVSRKETTYLKGDIITKYLKKDYLVIVNLIPANYMDMPLALNSYYSDDNKLRSSIQYRFLGVRQFGLTEAFDLNEKSLLFVEDTSEITNNSLINCKKLNGIILENGAAGEYDFYNSFHYFNTKVLIPELHFFKPNIALTSENREKFSEITQSNIKYDQATNSFKFSGIDNLYVFNTGWEESKRVLLEGDAVDPNNPEIFNTMNIKMDLTTNSLGLKFINTTDNKGVFQIGYNPTVESDENIKKYKGEGSYIFNEMSGNFLYFKNNGTLGYDGEVITKGRVTSLDTVGQISDERVKENFELIDNPFELIKSLNAYRYNFKDKTDKTKIGFKAQDVLKVIPEVVNKIDDKDENSLLSLSYGEMVPILVECIKEMKKEISSLKEEIECLKK